MKPRLQVANALVTGMGAAALVYFAGLRSAAWPGDDSLPNPAAQVTGNGCNAESRGIWAFVLEPDAWPKLPFFPGERVVRRETWHETRLLDCESACEDGMSNVKSVKMGKRPPKGGLA
jgi:hypothetical protein